jgi:hypothetical protein
MGERMGFWRPAHEWRGTRKPWFINTRLMEVGMSELAARAIYRAFNLFPDLAEPENDRDAIRW